MMPGDNASPGNQANWTRFYLSSYAKHWCSQRSGVNDV
jgi:hypothetical protein